MSIIPRIKGGGGEGGDVPQNKSKRSEVKSPLQAKIFSYLQFDFQFFVIGLS